MIKGKCSLIHKIQEDNLCQSNLNSLQSYALWIKKNVSGVDFISFIADVIMYI